MSILVAGVYRIGDAVMSLPALQYLAARYPEERITLLAPGSSVEVYRRSGLPLEVIPLPLRGRVLRFFFQIKNAAIKNSDRIDRVFLLSGGFVWALGAALARIPVRSGLVTDGRGFLLNRKIRLDAETIHQSEAYCRIAGLQSGGTVPLPQLQLLKDDFVAAGGFLRGWGGRPYFVAHPSASHPIKRWPAERFAGFCRGLMRQRGWGCLLLGGAAEEALLAGILPGEPGVLRAAGLPLGTVFGILAGAAFFAGNNTGLTHAAAALGVPGICLSGPSNTVKTAPLGAPFVVLGGSPRPVPERGRSPHPILLSITVEDALQAAASLPEPS